MTCQLLKKDTNNDWKDCDLVEQGANSGIVGYKDPACGTDKVCITIDQNYGKFGEVSLLNSAAWSSSLEFKLRCYIGVAAEDQKVEKDFTFEVKAPTFTPILKICGSTYDAAVKQGDTNG